MTPRAMSATLAGLLTLGVSLVAQQSGPTFKSTVNLVRVDAAVTDATGNPVTGLTAADFTLLDCGQPQDIAAFEEVHHEPRPSAPVGHQDVASNVADGKSEMMVLVLDDVHIRKEWSEHARNIVEDFVRELNDDTLVALISTSGKYGVELTSDRQRIIDAIETFEGRAVRPVYIAPAFEGLKLPPMPSSPGGSGAPHVNPMASRTGGNVGKGGLEGPPWDSPTLFNALAQAARMLSSDQTRHKALGWISSGELYAAEGMREAIGRMRQSGVTTYAIDPVGSANANPGGVYESSGCLAFVWQPCDPRTPWQAGADASRASLTRTARATGGIAIVGDDDLAGGVRHIVSNFGAYYTLGFYPSDTTTPGERPISVQVKRPGVGINARMSYSLAEALPTSPEKTLPALASGLVPKSELPLRMFAAALPPATTRADSRVAVTLEITARASALANATGDLSDDLTYAVFAVDLRKGTVVRSVTEKAALTLKPVAGRPSPELVYAVETSLALPPGHFQIRASATSAKTGTAGSVYALVDVPDFRRATLAISDIVIGDSTVPLAKTARAHDALGDLAFAPTLNRTVTPGQPLHVYAEYAASRGHEPLDVRVALIDEHGAETWFTTRTLDKSATGTLDLRITAPSVAAGAYALRLTIGDEAKTVSRDVAVTIR